MCFCPIVLGPIAARNKAVDIYLRGGGPLENKQPKSLYKAKNGKKVDHHLSGRSAGLSGVYRS